MIHFNNFLLRELKGKNIMRYLFICGCARSGTTALWKVVSAHHKIALGCERYNKLFRNHHEKISEELFEKNRFFNIQEYDTHYSKMEDMPPYILNYFLELPKYYDDCVYFGDKFPQLFNFYDLIKSKFPESKIIFIMRNIFDVANSFAVRAANSNGNWPEKRNAAASIQNWNISLRNTIKYLDQLDFHIIQYERFFYEGEGLDELFSFIGLDIQDSVDSVYCKMKDEAIKKEKERQNRCLLSSLDKLDISRRARFDLFRSLHSLQNKK